MQGINEIVELQLELADAFDNSYEVVEKESLSKDIETDITSKYQQRIDSILI